jgi:voltage-dependent potassium channel beta subunit
MNYRRLGQSGLKVSELALGSWVTYGGQVGEEVARPCILEAYEAGINFFDCADAYAQGNAEVVLGNSIKELPRHELILSSKVFWPTMKGPNGRGLSRKHIFESIHASLQRMGTDYLDLYFCHRFDPETPVEEIVRTMDDLVHQGKVLYWGVSEWRGSQIAAAYGLARELGCIPPAMEQPQYNLFHSERVEDELKWVAETLGIGITTWSPLAFGVLSGKYNTSIPKGSRATLPGYEWMRKDILSPKRIAKARKFTDFAKRMGVTPSQLAIAWCLRTPWVNSVITGATSVEQLRENLKAAKVVPKLSEDVLKKLKAIFESQSA